MKVNAPEFDDPTYCAGVPSSSGGSGTAEEPEVKSFAMSSKLPSAGAEVSGSVTMGSDEEAGGALAVWSRVPPADSTVLPCSAVGEAVEVGSTPVGA